MEHVGARKPVLYWEAMVGWLYACAPLRHSVCCRAADRAGKVSREDEQESGHRLASAGRSRDVLGGVYAGVHDLLKGGGGSLHRLQMRRPQG